MKKITFKVSSSKDGSLISLIKEINRISCRISIDTENGLIEVENADDSPIDEVIELINNYYTILSVDINNTFEEATQEQVVYTVADASEEPLNNEANEGVSEKQYAVLKPQSENNLITPKVEFENEYIRNQINNLLKSVYWALYTQKAPEKEIGEHIMTCISEISMRYLPNNIIDFAVGDIVDVNYGVHLPGEIKGGHVSAIVCHILKDNIVYVVPITKIRTDISSPSYLFINVPQDATYSYSNGGTVILDKGKYIRAERFNAVIGKTNPIFFEKLLHQLAYTFDFTDSLNKTEDTPNNVAQTPNEAKDTTNNVVKSKKTTKKISIEETALLEYIGFALDKLNPSQKAEEQIESFLTDIGMTTTERVVTQSFIIACDIDKIKYESVILELSKKFPKVKVEIIRSILKESFKNWLNQYPDLVEKCRKISFMSLLKVFAKKLA